MKVWAAICAAITAALALVAVVIEPEQAPNRALSSDEPQAGPARCATSRQPAGTRPTRGRAVEVPIGEGRPPMSGLVLAPRRDAIPDEEILPFVVLGHPEEGNRCDLIWLSRYLAGRGYVVLTYSGAPEEGSTPLARGIDRMRAGIAFAGRERNPFRRVTDVESIGVGGFSFGAEVASVVQSDEQVDAAVMLDNLARWRRGDPGGATDSCSEERKGEVTPGAPALGLAMDAPCRAEPGREDAGLKQSGFGLWREEGVASGVFVLRGLTHADFSDKGNARQRQLIGYFAEAWFDRWLGGEIRAQDRLLADRVIDRPVRDQLSDDFDSGLYIPGDVDTTDYP